MRDRDQRTSEGPKPRQIPVFPSAGLLVREVCIAGSEVDSIKDLNYAKICCKPGACLGTELGVLGFNSVAQWIGSMQRHSICQVMYISYKYLAPL